MKNQEEIVKNEQKRTLSKASKLFNRNYLLLWQGQLVSRLGTQVYSIVIVIWLKHLLENSESVGSTIGSFFMLSAIPMVLFSAFGGAVADRFPRKKIIVYGDIFSGLVVLALGIFLFIEAAGNSVIITAVFMVGISLSTVSAFFGPAISASLPDIVPEDKLSAANSMGQLSQKISVFFGQGLGQPLMALLGFPALVILNGISYLISAFSESFIEIPQIIPEKAKSWSEYFRVFKADLGEGFKFIWSNGGLKKLLISSIILNFMTMPIIILMPFFVEDYLGAHIRWYGILLAIYGIGSMAGFSLAGIFKVKGRQRTRYLIAFMMAEPIGYTIVTLVNTPIQAAVLLFLGGMFSGFVMVHFMTILQVTTPTNIRGRVFGTNTTISSSTAPLGMGIGGILFDVFNHNIALIYTSAGILMLILVISISFSRDFRDFIAYDEEDIEMMGFDYTVRKLKEEETKKPQNEIYLENLLKKPRSEI